jgi:hypothetical protein
VHPIPTPRPRVSTLPCCFGFLLAIAPMVLPGSCYQVARAFLQFVHRLVTLVSEASVAVTDSCTDLRARLLEELKNSLKVRASSISLRKKWS